MTNNFYGRIGDRTPGRAEDGSQNPNRATPTLFHIEWGDGDSFFIIAHSKEEAVDKMPDGKDMVRHVIQLDAVYNLLYQQALRDVGEFIKKNRVNNSDVDSWCKGVMP